MATGALFVALASEVGNEFAIENDMEVDPIRGPKMIDGVRDGADSALSRRTGTKDDRGDEDNPVDNGRQDVAVQRATTCDGGDEAEPRTRDRARVSAQGVNPSETKVFGEQTKNAKEGEWREKEQGALTERVAGRFGGVKTEPCIGNRLDATRTCAQDVGSVSGEVFKCCEQATGTKEDEWSQKEHGAPADGDGAIERVAGGDEDVRRLLNIVNDASARLCTHMGAEEVTLLRAISAQCEAIEQRFEALRFSVSDLLQQHQIEESAVAVARGALATTVAQSAMRGDQFERLVPCAQQPVTPYTEERSSSFKGGTDGTDMPEWLTDAERQLEADRPTDERPVRRMLFREDSETARSDHCEAAAGEARVAAFFSAAHEMEDQAVTQGQELGAQCAARVRLRPEVQSVEPEKRLTEAADCQQVRGAAEDLKRRQAEAKARLEAREAEEHAKREAKRAVRTEQQQAVTTFSKTAMEAMERQRAREAATRIQARERGRAARRTRDGIDWQSVFDAQAQLAVRFGERWHEILPRNIAHSRKLSENTQQARAAQSAVSVRGGRQRATQRRRQHERDLRAEREWMQQVKDQHEQRQQEITVALTQRRVQLEGREG